jgi:hypothetical protein
VVLGSGVLVYWEVGVVWHSVLCDVGWWCLVMKFGLVVVLVGVG